MIEGPLHAFDLRVEPFLALFTELGVLGLSQRRAAARPGDEILERCPVSPAAQIRESSRKPTLPLSAAASGIVPAYNWLQRQHAQIT